MKNFPFMMTKCQVAVAQRFLVTACLAGTLVSDPGLAAPTNSRSRKSRTKDVEATETTPSAKESKSKKEAEETTVKAPPVPQQIRGMLGLVSGLRYVGNIAFVLGADYARMIRPNMWVVGGVSRWSNTYSDPAYSIDFALTALDGGMEYTLPVTDELSFKGLARAGVGLASAATQESVLGELEKKSESTTAFGLTIGGAVTWKTGAMEFGGELRKPIYLAELAEGSSVAYLLGTFGFSL
ncbi:MAG: hypothetical protein RIQ81_221 [Pseudomonadota bacterium]